MAEAAATSTNGTAAKAKLVAEVIGRIGIPGAALLILLGSIIWMVWAMLTGQVHSPFITEAEFRQHTATNDQIHDAMIRNATANTEALQETTKALKHMNCEHKATDAKKLECFRALNGVTD